MLGTTSIARVTTNTHRAKAASTLTATLLMVYPLSSRSTNATTPNENMRLIMGNLLCLANPGGLLPITRGSSPRNVCNITFYGGERIPQMSDI